jgi:hypothetical protein
MAFGGSPSQLGSLQELAQQGRVPGAASSPASGAPPLAIAAPLAPVVVDSPSDEPPLGPLRRPPGYVPIGTPPGDVGSAPQPSPRITQAQADAALQASLTDGGPVAGKGNAPAAPQWSTTLPPPAPAGKGTPAGMRPDTLEAQVKSGTPITPQLAGSEAAIQSADRDLGTAQRNVLAEQPDQDAVRAAQEKIAQVHQAQADEQFNRDMANATAGENWKREQAHAAYDEAVAKGVDPNHYYHDKGVGGALAAAGAALLGGFSGGLLGGIGKFIGKQIDTDIQEQKDAIDRKGKAAEQADTHMAMFMKEGLNKQQAYEASKALAWKNFSAQLDRQAQNAPAQVKLRLAQAQQAIAQKVNEHDMAFAKETGDQVTKTVKDKWEKAVAAGGGGGDLRKEYQAYWDKHQGTGDVAKPYGQWLAERGGAGGAGVPKVGGADKPMSPRLITRVADLDEAEEAAKGLSNLLGAGGSSFSMGDRQLATEKANVLRKMGYAVPEDPLELFSNSGARKAVVEDVLGQIQRKRATVTKLGAHTGGGGAETESAEP